MDNQPHTKKPVIFTDFANPFKGLVNLNREQNSIQTAKEVIKNLWQRNDLGTEAHFRGKK